GACERCLADVAAADALLALDVTGAEVPVLAAGDPRPIPGPGVRAIRALSGVAAVGLLVVAAMIGAGALREDGAGPGAAALDPTESPDGEGILAGTPSFTPLPSVMVEMPSPSASATERAEPSEEPSASEVATGAAPTQPPFVAPPPPAITPGPTAAVTPRPTTAATPV